VGIFWRPGRTGRGRGKKKADPDWLDQAYRAAVVSGISPVEFWNLTPYQTRIAMEATLERFDKQAWMIAAFSRAKKLPKYGSLTRNKRKGARPGMEAELKAYFGGRKEKRK